MSARLFGRAGRSPSRPGPRLRPTIVVGLATIVVLVGCGQDDEEPGTAGEQRDPSVESDDDATGGQEAPTDVDDVPHGTDDVATDPAGEEQDMDEPSPNLGDPGPLEPTDELVLDELSLSETGRNVEALHATFSVTNTTDATRRFILPTVAPRVEDEDDGRRLSYLRVAFTHDDDGVSNTRVDEQRPGFPETISVAAGDTVTVDREIRVLGIQVADRMGVCFEVLPPSPDGSPNATAATGEERQLVAGDVGYDSDDPVPVICSEMVDISG